MLSLKLLRGGRAPIALPSLPPPPPPPPPPRPPSPCPPLSLCFARARSRCLVRWRASSRGWTELLGPLRAQSRLICRELVCSARGRLGVWEPTQFSKEVFLAIQAHRVALSSK